MLLCFKESATKTVGWHISIVSIKDNGWVQPPATFPPRFLQRGNPCSGEMEGARALFWLEMLLIHKTGWCFGERQTRHGAAAQQLQVLRWSTLQPYPLQNPWTDRKAGSSAFTTALLRKCPALLWISNTRLTLILLLALLLYLKGSPELCGYVSEQSGAAGIRSWCGVGQASKSLFQYYMGSRVTRVTRILLRASTAGFGLGIWYEKAF